MSKKKKNRINKKSEIINKSTAISEKDSEELGENVFDKTEKELNQEKQKRTDKILDIFRASTDEDIDMTKLDQKPDRKKAKIITAIIISLFILAGATLAGFLIFNKDYTTTQNSQVELTIQAVDQMSSGNEVTLEITYENKDTTAIKEGTITIHYPTGFYYKKAEPNPDTSDNTWQIKNIAPGAAGKIKITGQLVGELNEEKEFTGLLTYQPENFSSTFQDTISKKIIINDTIITLNANLPQVAFSGQEISYEVKFKNTSTLPLANAKINVNYPSGFTPGKAEPNADLDNNIWKYDEIKPQEEKIIKITGVLTGDSNENKEFRFQLGLEEPDGVLNVQVEKNNLVLIVNPDIKLTIAGPEYIKPNDKIDYKIVVENISDTNIGLLELKLNFTDGFIEKNNINLEKIENLKTGEKKEINYQTQIKNSLASAGSALTADLSVANAKVEGEKFDFKQTAQAVGKIKGELSFTAQARYYDDDLAKIGTGPIPPQVGQATSYVIWWNIVVTTGSINNLQITSSVPEIVDGIESTDSALVYDKTNKQIKWIIANLAEGESRKIAFTVFITPTKDQLNKLLVLTKETVVNAIDNNTNENISLNIERLTSDLPNDPAAAGKGVVEQKP